MNQAEEELFNVIRQHPKLETAEEQFLRDLPDLSKDMVPFVNGSPRRYFVTVGKQLCSRRVTLTKQQLEKSKFSAGTVIIRLIHNINTSTGHVCNFMKAKGTCIKVIEAESGLHHQVVNDTIKTLKKFRRNRSVKSVKYVGSPWFAENELDVHFIEGLMEMTSSLFPPSYPRLSTVPQQQIAAEDHAGYEHPCDILVFLKCSGILKVSLTLADIQMSGKVSCIRRDGPCGIRTMDEDDGDGDGGVVEMWMQKGVSGENTPGVYWNYVPCGRCAVSGFCKSGGPVSPEGCLYFNKWLEF
ncbi:hypothetical protein BC830DRAFT_1090676 [Chytriomyces sp. MP71]|nr:hypothetical protein BC830DRAFT_1090676 [Chytriomyces sp. MP71]